MSRRRQGLSLVEVLMALSLTAVMMVAIFQAVNASFISFRANQSNAMLTMRTRMVLMRMLDHIRATSLHQPLNSLKLAAWQLSPAPVDDDGIVLAETQSDDKTLIFYKYYLDKTNTGNYRLKMSRSGTSIATTDNVLLNNVASFNIRMWSGKSDPTLTSYDVLTRAVITMQVKEQTTGTATGSRITGSNTTPDAVTLSGSAVPRQNAWSGRRLTYSINAILTQTH